MRRILGEWSWLWVGAPLVYGWFWVFFALGPTVPPGQALPTWWYAVVFVLPVFLIVGGLLLYVQIDRWRVRRRRQREEFSD